MDSAPVPVEPGQHAAAKDDPKQPWKMYAAIVSAFLSSFVTTNATDLPAWAVGLITAAIAAIAVFVVPNPKTAA